MNHYTLTFTEEQMEFLRQLAQSQIPITMQAAKVAASIQDIVLSTKPVAAAIHEPG